ncbi:hypothetical protein V8D89_007088 [Ganoderma adspersum]
MSRVYIFCTGTGILLVSLCAPWYIRTYSWSWLMAMALFCRFKLRYLLGDVVCIVWRGSIVHIGIGDDFDGSCLGLAIWDIKLYVHVFAGRAGEVIVYVRLQGLLEPLYVLSLQVFVARLRWGSMYVLYVFVFVCTTLERSGSVE